MNRRARGRVHVVVGEPDLVRAALEVANTQGRLLVLGQPVHLADGRLRVAAELLDPSSPPAAERAERARRWLAAARVLGALAVAGGLVWLVVLGVLALVALVTAVVGWVAGHLVWIGGGLLGLLLLAGRGGRCGGVHCGGCRR